MKKVTKEYIIEVLKNIRSLRSKTAKDDMPFSIKIDDLRELCDDKWSTDLDKYWEASLKSNEEYYNDLESSIIKNGWDSKEPCEVSIIESPPKNGILISDGMHRLCVYIRNKLKNDIPIVVRYTTLEQDMIAITHPTHIKWYDIEETI